jgi:hypothetical protein
VPPKKRPTVSKETYSVKHALIVPRVHKYASTVHAGVQIHACEHPCALVHIFVNTGAQIRAYSVRTNSRMCAPVLGCRV